MDLMTGEATNRILPKADYITNILKDMAVDRVQCGQILVNKGYLEVLEQVVAGNKVAGVR